MKLNPRFLVIPALVAGLQAASAADVTGTVTLNGKPPEEKVIDMSSIPDCGKAHSEPVKTQFYVVGSNNGLKDVVVAIRNVFNPLGRCSPSKLLPIGSACIERKSPGHRASA